MSLKPSSRVQKLQETQHTRAQESPSHRCYALYEQVCQRDVLETAYQQRRTHGGGAGVDGQTLAEMEKYGVTKWLDELEEELSTIHYQPATVRRVHTPKPGGKQRRLHIPTIRHRVVQMAVLLVIEPIFEADLTPEKYAQLLQLIKMWLVAPVEETEAKGRVRRTKS